MLHDKYRGKIEKQRKIKEIMQFWIDEGQKAMYQLVVNINILLFWINAVANLQIRHEMLI